MRDKSFYPLDVWSSEFDQREGLSSQECECLHSDITTRSVRILRTQQAANQRAEQGFLTNQRPGNVSGDMGDDHLECG